MMTDVIQHRKKTGEHNSDYLQHFIDSQAKLDSKENDMGESFKSHYLYFLGEIHSYTFFKQNEGEQN